MSGLRACALALHLQWMTMLVGQIVRSAMVSGGRTKWMEPEQANPKKTKQLEKDNVGLGATDLLKHHATTRLNPSRW